MNQIIRGFLNGHIQEYGIDGFDEKPAFEHFIDRCVTNRYVSERFDPQDIMTDKGEIGLDGVVIVVNGQIVVDIDMCKLIYAQQRNISVKFVFIQSKTSESFDGGDMSTFFKGIKHFFEPANIRPKTNEKMENLIAIKDYVYSQIINQVKKPSLEMYYVCCGKWDEGNNLSNNILTDVTYFKNTEDFSDVIFYPYDNEKIIIMYKEMRRKISRSFVMEKRMSFFNMQGIKVAYFGLLKCHDLASLLIDEQGNLFNNIFEDNVRDFQGYNPVNSEIKTTIEDSNDQNRFAVLNNGITIIAKKIETEGDTVTIFDYQIVNGCQTSRVLFDNKEHLSEDSYLLAKIIQVDTDDVLDRIVYTSNRQTEVKYEAFTSANHFHKMLQEYYNSVDIEYRLYYERRSKQYDMDATINKNKVVTLAGQTFAYISMFLNEPHSVNRYYGEVLDAYKKRIYGKDDKSEPYFISAYYLYAVELAIRQNRIDRKYKIFKYHICCAMKALIINSKILRGNSRDIKTAANTLFDIARSPEEFYRILNTSCSCIDDTLKLSNDIPETVIFRSKDFTIRMLETVRKYTKSREVEEHLEKGQVVSCQVTAIRPYNIEVALRTDDTRNRGSIHISQIANRYIQNISDEAKMGEILQTKILNDNYDENSFGWRLSLILD